jgi:hypothetical protein
MALSFETGGFKFAPTLVPVDQQSLQGLKPLSFTGGGQSPIQFKPLAGWSIPSSRPELIGQGLASAAGSVAQGITAAYKSAREDEKDIMKFEQQKELKQMELAQSGKRIAEQAAERKDALDETIRHNKEMEAAALDRIESVGGNKGKSLSARILRGSQEAGKTNSTEPEATTEPARFFGRDPETNYLKQTEPVKTEQKKLSENAVDQQSQIFAEVGNIGNLFSPATISYVNANSLPVGARIDVPSAVHSTPTNPANDPKQVVGYDKETGEPMTLGELSATTFGGITPVLNAFESGTADGIYGYQTPADQPALSDVKPVDSKAMEDAIGIEAIYDERDALALRDYAIKKGIMPKLAARKNGVEVTWPDDAMKKYIEGLGGKQGSEKKPEEIFKEAKELRGEFIDGAKNFKVMQNAWNNLKGKLNNPTGASDMSMIFAYMKLLDPTSTIREGEYATASNVGTIPQTIWGKFNKALAGNGFLDPKVRSAFINEAKDMYESSLRDHKQSKEVYTKLAKRNNIDPEDVVIDLVSKTQEEQEKEEMEALGNELRVVADKDRATYPNFYAKKERYKALYAKDQEQKKLNEEAKKAPATQGQNNQEAPKTPVTQSQNNQAAGGKSIFSNLLIPPVRLATF